MFQEEHLTISSYLDTLLDIDTPIDQQHPVMVAKFDEFRCAFNLKSVQRVIKIESTLELGPADEEGIVGYYITREGRVRLFALNAIVEDFNTNGNHGFLLQIFNSDVAIICTKVMGIIRIPISQEYQLAKSWYSRSWVTGTSNDQRYPVVDLIKLDQEMWQKNC